MAETYAEAVARSVKLIQARRFDEARQAIAHLANTFPGNPMADVLLLNLFVEQRDYGNAVRLAEALAPRMPDNAIVQALCVRAFRQAGRVDTALELAERTSQRFPDIATVQNELGLIRVSVGRGDEAMTAFNRAITIDPRFIPAYWSRSRLAPGRLDQAQRQDMIDMANDAGFSVEERAMLDFSIAWAFDGIDADQQFAYLHRANSAIASIRPWNEAAQRERLRQTREFFSASLFEQARPFVLSDIAPVFVVGLPRSGTSLVEQILASHSMITGCGETGGIETAVAKVAAAIGTGRPLWEWSDPDGIGAFFRPLDEVYRRHLGVYEIDTPLFTEKSLSSEWWVGLLLLMYPRAKVVHCTRNPLDTCLSMYRLHFTVGQEYSYDLAWIANAIRIHAELMAHWETVFPGRIATVNYETLVNHQRDTTGELLGFCGIAWEESCMEFHKRKRTARTASDSQIKQPLCRSAVNRWKPYAKHLKPAADILGLDIESGE